MSRLTLIFCILCVACLPLMAATGDLDPAFGSSGFYRWVPQPPDTYPSFLREEEALDMAVDSHGRSLLALLEDDGSTGGYAYPSLVRLTPNGLLDTTFGVAGRWTESVYAAPDSSTVSVGVDSSDRALVGFTAAVSNGAGGPDQDFAVR